MFVVSDACGWAEGACDFVEERVYLCPTLVIYLLINYHLCGRMGIWE